MARDKLLEQRVEARLAGEAGLTARDMFGGRAWLLNGNLLCAARTDGLLVRLGKGRDGWALDVPGIATVVMGDRRLNGWVGAAPPAVGETALHARLLDAALAFNRTLPPKHKP